MKKITFFSFFIFFILVFLFFFNFDYSKNEKKLPILGSKYLVKKEINGSIKQEIIYHTINDFNFVDQCGVLINKKVLKDKIYVADFFFTNCPTICPIMTTQMLRVYNKYKDNFNFKIISHSIDPYNDKIEVLKKYAKNIGILNNKT